MKRRLSAIMLALGLSVSVFSMGVYAEEAQTEATEQVTEATTEAETEAPTEALAEDAAAQTESAETETAQTEAMSQEDQVKSILAANLTQVSSWTDEQIEMLIESDDATSASIASNWKSVKEELGGFVEVTDAQLSADGMEITGHAKYEKISGSTEVEVCYSIDQKAGTATMNWEIDYPMGVLMQRAAMNTIMGIGIVFVALLFLSFLIGQLHIIPDMIEKRTKKAAPAPAAPAAAPVAAPAVEEEELVDDLELVAVITAAIAASSESTSGDGFVVRSIKKANKRNWQRA